MTMRTPLVAALALLVLSSGCVTSQSAETAEGPIASGEAFEDAATISGIVVDDAQTPLQGAVVAIVALTLQVETDAAGSFKFVNVPPGQHEVNAIKLGFESGGRRIDVEAGQQMTGVIITLSPMVIDSVYHETVGPMAGFFGCMVGTPVGITACTGDRFHNQPVATTVFPDEKRFLEFNMGANHWQTMIGESRWNQGSASTGQGMAIYPSHAKREGSHWWCEADGPSPLLFRYEKENEEGNICTSQGEMEPAPSMDINPLVVVADPGFGNVNTPVRLMVQQKFELMVTIFYGEAAPANFSALSDA